MSKSTKEHRTAVSRRRLVQAMGVTSLGGLAGCNALSGSDGDGDDGGDGGDGGGGGGDGGDGGDLGERVPDVQFEYWSDYGGFTTTQEQMAPIMANNIEELGVGTNIVPVDISTQLGRLAADENRDIGFTFGWWVPTADRLDPEELMQNYRIDWAGAQAGSNYWNWADCTFTELLLEQAGSESVEEREGKFEEMIRYLNDQVVSTNLCPVANIGAWRTDKVEMGGIGTAGIARSNAEWLFESRLTDSSEDFLTVAIDPIAVETTNFPTYHASMPEAQWQHMIHSPVHKYDENLEIRGLLGDVNVADANLVEIELYDDANFTNGDPVTAEDVKFTLEQVIRGGEAGAYPGAIPHSYEEFEVIDEKNLDIHFSENEIPFANTTLMRWGIWHKASFEEAGAVEDPGGVRFEPPIVSSGPLEVVSFDPGERVIAEARDNHPVFKPEDDIVFQAARTEESAIRALQAGEVHIAPEISPPNAIRVNEEIENAQAEFRDAWTTYLLMWVPVEAPAKFIEFRKAVGQTMDRQRMVDVAFNGQVDVEEYGTQISRIHPFYPEDEEGMYRHGPPSGDPERGREILEEAGWGWDNNGNLRYPSDADLSPVWEQGEAPDPNDFPCLEDL